MQNLNGSMSGCNEWSLKFVGIHHQTIVRSIITSSKTTSAHMTTKFVGLDCFFIIKGLLKRIHLEGCSKPLWSSHKCQEIFDTHTKEVRNIVREWWHTETILSPNKKDIYRLCIAKKLLFQPMHTITCRFLRFFFYHLLSSLR